MAVAVSVTSFARELPGGSGGGNSVGDDLLDDAENAGSVLIPKAELEQLVNPLLANLATRLPGFAEKLKEGLAASPRGLKWYREPKALDQNGPCRNASNLKMDQVVRACQNDVDVRIDKGWYDSNPPALGALILHELLVFQRLRNNPRGISETKLREVSREIRNSDSQTMLSQEQLQELVESAGFGSFPTKTQEIEATPTIPANQDVCDHHLPGNQLVDFYASLDGKIHNSFAVKDSRGRTHRVDAKNETHMFPFYGLSVIRSKKGVFACIGFPGGDIAMKASIAFLNEPTRGIQASQSGIGVGLKVKVGSYARAVPKTDCVYYSRREVCVTNQWGRQDCRWIDEAEETACRNGEKEYGSTEKKSFSLVDAAGKPLVDFYPL